MSSRPKFNSPEAIARRISEGRGQGAGPYYIPWIMVSDFSSWGQRRRSYCHKNQRAAHTLSRLEFKNFILAEADDEVIDLQENFPLNLEKSQDIASDLKIKHPRVSKDCPIVMSTDLRLTLLRNGKIRYKIWTTKYTDALRNWRTLEKLRIDEKYWETEKDHSWELRTEQGLPRDFLDNLEWLRPMLRPGSLFGISDAILRNVDQSMREPISRGNSSLVEIAEWCDGHLSLTGGTSQLIVRYLLAHRVWQTDLRAKLNPLHPIRITFA